MIGGPDPSDPMLQSPIEGGAGILVATSTAYAQLHPLGVRRILWTYVFHCFVTKMPDVSMKWETTSAKDAALLFVNESFDEDFPPPEFVTTRDHNGEEVRWHIPANRRWEAHVVGPGTDATKPPAASRPLRLVR